MSTVVVGDPVDIMTGVQFDVALDLRIPWAMPFEWRRFYDTSRSTEFLPLGWGHTHSYDHRLTFDVDGLLYVDPTGARHAFSYPDADGRSSPSANGMLRRIQSNVCRVKVRRQPECEFHFQQPGPAAQLRRIMLGRAVHELLYDGDGRWTGVAYSTEPVVRVVSDAAGLVQALWWIKADSGRDYLLWQAEYDAHGNVTSITDAYQTTQTFGYDAAHRMVRRTDRRGYGFVAVYDRDSRCEYSAGEDGVQAVRMQYLPTENVTVVTRADGGVWQYAYEPHGVTRIVDPYGGVTERIFGPFGLEREVGPMGEILREVIDDESTTLRAPHAVPSGMCLPVGDPWLDAVRDVYLPRDALGWDGFGKAVCRNAIRLPWKDAHGLADLPEAVTRYIRYAERPEEGAQTRPVGGPGPDPKKVIAVPPRPGTFRHDALGRLLSHMLPGGESCRWQYDANGNVKRYVDYAGSTWLYDYASWNLLVKETNPLGHATTFEHNPLEQPTRVTDGGGTSTQQRFDLKDRLDIRGRQDAVRDVFGYDRSRGLTSVATEDGAVRLALSTGPNGRPGSVTPAGKEMRKCMYDEHGRLVSVVAEDGDSVLFAYDAFGDHTLDVQNGRGVERRYEAARVAACVVLERFAVHYEHNSNSGQTTIVDPLGGRHVVAYLDSGVVLRSHANGVRELSQYDWDGRCLAKVRFGANRSSSVWSRVFRYSPVGALVGVTDNRRGISAFTYDAAHRLIGAMTPDGSAHFSHDKADNLIASPSLEGVRLTENRLASANGRRFEYTDRHNLAADIGNGRDTYYAYDVEDRLVSCRTGDTELSYEYDALGRRLAKITSAGRTTFIWDGERLAAEIAASGELRVYVYADGVARTPFTFIDYEGVDADPATGRRRYVFSDQVACPTSVEDDAGETLWRATVDPYGHAAIDPASTIELNLRWPGHYFDPETSLHYNRHRYYSPELGRYVQVDPRDIGGGVNVYAYTARPLDTVDVDGLAPCPKKPMINPEEGDPEFAAARARADELANELRAALRDARANGEMHPMAEAGTTLAVLVVQRAGPPVTYEVVVTGNRSDTRLPVSVTDAMGDHRFIGHGDDAPPRITQSDNDWRYERDNPRTGERQPTTHNHAEQRGLRAADCDPNTNGVAYVAPTRPCCEGCSSAIRTPHSDGGWGGGDSNVSPLGGSGTH